MATVLYQPKFCTQCVSLVDAGTVTQAHSGLGRPRPEVGYSLYRCTVCHAHWSLSPKGWAAETPFAR